MKRIACVLAAALVCTGLIACSAESGTKPFEELSADDIVSVSVNCTPPGVTVETDDEDKIEELVNLLSEQVIYEEDEKEYAGQSVIFTIYKADGTETKVNAYNPQLIIDGVKYTTKSDPCNELSALGIEWADELSAGTMSDEEIQEMLASLPDEYDEADNFCYAIFNNGTVQGEEMYEEFIANAENGTAANVIIVRFTDEGDPIYTYLSYDGEEFYCVVDISRDKLKGGTEDYIEYSYKYIVSGGDYAFLVNDESITSYEQINGDDSIDYFILF